MARLQYVHPDLGDDPQIDPFAGADMALATAIENFLQTNYPRQARYFDALVSHRTGVVTLSMPRLMGSTNCFVLHISRLKAYNLFVADMHRGVGELLERFKLPRDHRFSIEKFAETAQRLPTTTLKDSEVPT